jgi:hypothetical protein
MNEMDVIEWVEWIDSVGCPAGWEVYGKTDLEKIEPKEIQSVGFNIKETDKFIVLAPTAHSRYIDDSEREFHAMGLIVIPKCAILRMSEMVTKEAK